MYKYIQTIQTFNPTLKDMPDSLHPHVIAPVDEGGPPHPVSVGKMVDVRVVSVARIHHGTLA